VSSSWSRRTWLPRAVVFVAIAVAIVRATPNAGVAALQTWLATTVLARGVPTGSASLGWLGALGSFAAARVAPIAPALVCAAFALGAFALVERRARALGAGPAASILAVPLAALCTVDALVPGGGALAWCFTALAMIVLETPTTRRLAAFAALALVWCNVEPEGLVAPVLALAVALGASIDSPRDARAGARWIAVVVASLACLCTPAGFAFPVAAFDALRLGDAAHGILATAPAATTPHAYTLGLFAIVAGALASGAGVRARDALPVAFAFVLALASGPFVPLFGVVAAPAIVTCLGKARVPALLPVGFAALAVAAVVVALRAAPSDALARQPFELAAHAATSAPTATLLCANAEWCDTAFAAGGRVVMDGRVAAYGERDRATQRTVVALGRGWSRALARSGATRVLARNDSSLDTLLAMSAGWRAIARDDRATLFARTP
jgi:hypothetical protein